MDGENWTVNSPTKFSEKAAVIWIWFVEASNLVFVTVKVEFAIENSCETSEFTIAWSGGQKLKNTVILFSNYSFLILIIVIYNGNTYEHVVVLSALTLQSKPV